MKASDSQHESNNPTPGQQETTKHKHKKMKKSEKYAEKRKKRGETDERLTLPGAGMNPDNPDNPDNPMTSHCHTTNLLYMI